MYKQTLARISINQQLAQMRHGPSLARAEPKTLRYRLLHVAARLTRGQRGSGQRIDRNWPVGDPTQLAVAFARLVALPTPTG